MIARDHRSRDDLILQKYGSYEVYINNINNINIVDEEFIKIYYPEFIGDDGFKEFILELEPLFRDDVGLVKTLYEILNKLNEVE